VRVFLDDEGLRVVLGLLHAARDLGATPIRVVVLELQKLGANHLPAGRGAPEQLAQALGVLLLLRQLLANDLHLELGQAIELELQDRIHLHLVQVGGLETLPILTGRRGGHRTATRQTSTASPAIHTH